VSVGLVTDRLGSNIDETDRFEYSLPLNSCDGDPAPILEMPLPVPDAPLLEPRGYLIDPPEGGSIGEV
jgi:hypothetical protein